MCDVDRFRSLQVCTFISLHVVCDDDKFGSLEV